MKRAKITFEVELHNGIDASVNRAFEYYDNKAVAKFLSKLISEDQDIKLTDVKADLYEEEDNE